MNEPFAYFITFTTYGTWLHGRAPGSVDRDHNAIGTPFLPADAQVEHVKRAKMKQEPYLLDEPRRKTVLKTILEVALHRKWQLYAVHVRSNHVHVVVASPQKPEKIMRDFKAWCSRRLREAFDEPQDRERWTQHGSTRYLWNDDACHAAADYALNQQGPRMAAYGPSEHP